jgi:transposase
MPAPSFADWRDDSETLLRACLDEETREIKTRLHVLWLLRRGIDLRVVARISGARTTSVRRWLDWYQHGGIPEVRRRMYRGPVARLSRTQQQALLERARVDPFRSTQEARRWVEGHLGVRYTHSGMRWVLERLGLKEPGKPLRLTHVK